MAPALCGSWSSLPLFSLPSCLFGAFIIVKYWLSSFENNKHFPGMLPSSCPQSSVNLRILVNRILGVRQRIIVAKSKKKKLGNGRHIVSWKCSDDFSTYVCKVSPELAHGLPVNLDKEVTSYKVPTKRRLLGWSCKYV